jgi:predicted HD superfamily hydrolase involved in NAD metabolism
MDSTEILPILDRRLQALLSTERVAHSRGVAKLAAELCSRNGIPREKGMAAGLAHDICKELSRAEQKQLAQRWPGMQPGSSLMAGQLLHGPAAAAMLRQEFAYEEDDVLEAIALHTVGRPGMGPLAAIVYCADKMELGRSHVTDAFRDRCLRLPIEGMLRLVVSDVISWLESRGKVVAPETLGLYNCLNIPVPSR